MEKFIYSVAYMVYMGNTKEPKFKLKSELELFKALQRFGKKSNYTLSKKSGIFATTIQNVFKRINRRNFFHTGVIPKLSEFSEVPMAFIAFSDIHPVKLRQLKSKCQRKDQVRGFIHNDREAILFLMDARRHRIAELIFEIMEDVKARPTVHIMAPTISKLDLKIPDKVLDKVYSELPDKRRQ